MKKFHVDNIVWKEGKYFVAQCLNVDVSSFGQTKKEALANLQETLDLYFEDTRISHMTQIRRPEIVRSVFHV
jgi:predicted RNase H-like HicB family nuclease